MSNIPNYIQLGDEGVRRAAREMDSAADKMLRAAQYFDETVNKHQRILEEHAERMQAIINPELKS